VVPYADVSATVPRVRSPRAGDAISVADADAPPTVLATEDRRNPEVNGHEFVAAYTLNLRMFDGQDVAEIVAWPPDDLVERRLLTAHEHRSDLCCFGCDGREPDDRWTERVG
jgi:hypothetical protein